MQCGHTYICTRLINSIISYQEDSKEDAAQEDEVDDSQEQADDDQSKENDAADADSGEANDDDQKEESAEATDAEKDDSGETASNEEATDGKKVILKSINILFIDFFFNLKKIICTFVLHSS